MKKIIIGALLIFLALFTFAQEDYDDLKQQLYQQQFQIFNQQRLYISQLSMLTLGGWSVTNLAVGGILSTQTEGSTKYFHQMNAGWNIINLAIAGAGYLGIRKELKIKDWNFSNTVAAQHKMQKILLFNAGLDLAYMMSGVYLIERSKNDLENQDRFKGFGQSLILQGGFLFVFDLVQNQLHQRHGKKLDAYLDKIDVSVSPTGIRCIVKL